MSAKDFPPPYTTLGAVEIGLVFSTFLFGIETLQTYHYYRNYSRDYLALKTLVAVVWFLELGHSICAWHGFFLITVTFYGQPEHILNPPTSLQLIALFSGLIAIFVQGFFCFRIHKFSGRKDLPIVCFILSTLPLISTIALLVLLIKAGSFSALLVGTGHVVLTLGTAVVAPGHVLVAASMCYYLYLFKRTNEFQGTRSIIDTLIIWTIESTLITSVFSMIELILFLTRRNDLVWLAFFVNIGKLNSNTLLASLNGRDRLNDNLNQSAIHTGRGHETSTTFGFSASGKNTAHSAVSVIWSGLYVAGSGLTEDQGITLQTLSTPGRRSHAYASADADYKGRPKALDIQECS